MALPLPEDPNDAMKLADWLELYALIAGDGNSSHGDLFTALKAASIIDPRRVEGEALPTAVFDELRHRARAADRGYPFEIEGSVLRAKNDWKEHESYIFCLCLSYFRWKGLKKGERLRPDRVFEALSTEVAKEFVRGKARRFGWPREKSVFPNPFPKAVDELCQIAIREGFGFKAQQGVSTSGDGGLDVVAWRDHPDERPGKLIFFGACASGADWREKLRELSPRTFAENYMADSLVSPILSGFFVPHRIPEELWNRLTRDAGGMLFDRCRMAYLAPKLPSPCAHGNGLEWAMAQLDRMGTA